MKIMTVLGTRPEIIRLSLVIKLLDQNSEHLLVDTGQNYDDRLNGLFFRELGVRKPDYRLDVRAGSFGEQVGQILSRIEPLLAEHRPDRLLILGDTNSGLTAIVARRMGIPVYHMEAGNRCFDFRVPEEANRRIIDHISNVLMPYTQRSRENLLREGINSASIFVTGNPIKEVIDHHAEIISASTVLERMGLARNKYFLVTMHRAENVDVESRLRDLVEALAGLHEVYAYPVLCSLHPRTRARAKEFGIDLNRAGLLFAEPFGLFDFVHLEQSAFCLLSDSGTVQEEACIFRVPNVTIRDVTERPETIECGSNVLAGSDPATIIRLVKLVTERPANWQPPAEYLATNVAATVARILLGHFVAEENGIPEAQPALAVAPALRRG
ncbi:MAG: UDP-N-acetylglucosamine 2-epimerase (non-hydrolyzing) [Candidatus Angelobacter sp.]